MQPRVALFLLLGLAHLVGDFLLQTGPLIRAKSRLQPLALIGHGVIHYLLAAGFIQLLDRLLDPQEIISFRAFGFQSILIALAASHVVIDVGKILTVRRGWMEEGWAFSLDQFIHWLVLFVVVFKMLPPYGAWGYAPEWWNDGLGPTVLVLLVAYVAVVFGGGYWIRAVLQPLARRIEVENGDDLEHAGLYIGWLERFLALTALIEGSYAAVGFILAAKSIVRFPALRERAFAEYFLIGTLLSMVLTVFGAVFIALLVRS